MNIDFYTPGDSAPDDSVRGARGVPDLDPAIIRDGLLLASTDVVAEKIDTWTVFERVLAFDWAMREHLEASDNHGVQRRPKPSFVTAAEQEAKSAREREHEVLRHVIGGAPEQGLSSEEVARAMRDRGIEISNGYVQVLLGEMEARDEAVPASESGRVIWSRGPRLGRDPYTQSLAGAGHRLDQMRLAMREVLARPLAGDGLTSLEITNAIRQRGRYISAARTDEWLAEDELDGLAVKSDAGHWRGTPALRKLMEGKPPETVS